MMQGFIFELTYAELFIEEMSQSFMEINCKRSETIEMAERMHIAKFVLNIQLPIFEGFSLFHADPFENMPRF